MQIRRYSISQCYLLGNPSGHPRILNNNFPTLKRGVLCICKNFAQPVKQALKSIGLNEIQHIGLCYYYDGEMNIC